MMDLSVLNREQRKAAETLEGPVLILAGAGSGKTRALTYRVANLIEHGVPAFSILALTFTNKAAREMKNRVQTLIGAEAANEAWISTFHSTCARILRRDIEKIGYSRSFVIYDDDDQVRLLKEIYKQLNLDDKFLPIREVKGKISDAKNALMTPDEWFQQTQRDYRNNKIHDVMTLYEKRLKTLNALDFDDLLLKTLVLFAEHPPVLDVYRYKFRYVMVDEYQDTNKAQYELIRLLTAESRNLCVVGDDDQSIYGWRGADIHNILDFEKDFPDTVVIKLEQNYRSTAIILDAANQVIAHNEERKDKRLWTERNGGEKIRLYCAENDRDEAEWITDQIRTMKRNGEPYSHTAILYRTNAQSRVPEETLMNAGIPYKVFGGQKFYDRKEIKDILAYLRVIVNPSDDISLSRILNVPKRAIGDTTVQRLSECAAENDIPLFSTLADPPESVSARARKSVQDFFRMMTLLSVQRDDTDLEQFLNILIDKTGLEEQYRHEDTEEALSRLENINEMRNSVHEYVLSAENPTLEGFLENVSLVTDLDRDEGITDCVVLMTLHSAKGLEFDNVFIPGLEENIFPSYRSLTEEGRMEEERRLMYVGITRARRRLFLSYAASRMMFDGFRSNPPSPFIDEIPERLIERTSSIRENRMAPYMSAKKTYANRFMNSESLSSGRNGVPRASGSPSMPKAGMAPRLTLKGKALDSIPGVTRGFHSAQEKAATQNDTQLYHPGDRVFHSKFGAGTVLSLSGTGTGKTITIRFDQAGNRVLSLLVAPITKLEEDRS